MKRLFLLVAMISVISITLFAQSIGSNQPNLTGVMGYHGDFDKDGIENHLDKDFINKYKPNWEDDIKSTTDTQCPMANRQHIGDGTRPQPKDGTGFGAKLRKRQGCNRKSKMMCKQDNNMMCQRQGNCRHHRGCSKRHCNCKNQKNNTCQRQQCINQQPMVSDN